MTANIADNKNINKKNSYPNFSDKSDEFIKKYIYNYIENNFKLRTGLLKRLPINMQEEAKNEIFIDLWKNKDNYDNKKGAFSTYAYYRGTYIVSKIVRKEFKKPDQTRLGKGRYLNKELESLDILYFIQDIKETLSVDYLELFELKFEKDMKVKNISKIMGISVPSVYKMLKKLKKQISRLDN